MIKRHNAFLPKVNISIKASIDKHCAFLQLPIGGCGMSTPSNFDAINGSIYDPTLSEIEQHFDKITTRYIKMRNRIFILGGLEDYLERLLNEQINRKWENRISKEEEEELQKKIDAARLMVKLVEKNIAEQVEYFDELMDDVSKLVKGE